MWWCKSIHCRSLFWPSVIVLFSVLLGRGFGVVFLNIVQGALMGAAGKQVLLIWTHQIIPLPPHLDPLPVWLRRECMSLYHFSWLCTQWHSPKLLSESQMTIMCSSFSSTIEERVKHMSARANRYPRRKWLAEERDDFFSSKLSFSSTTITPYFCLGLVERESYSSAQESRHPRGRWRTEGRKVIFTSLSIIRSLYHFPCRKLGITSSLRPCPHQLSHL